MTQSKSFEKFVESKGIDIDDDYHWLSTQEQEEIETEFKEEESDECKKHRLSIDDGE
jgi:hypothetical protein